jgi:hypothetical protein
MLLRLIMPHLTDGRTDGRTDGVAIYHSKSLSVYLLGHGKLSFLFRFLSGNTKNHWDATPPWLSDLPALS